MADPVNERKLEHLRAIESDPQVERDGRHFDRIALRHRALPELDLAEVDTRTTFLGKELSFPLLISSMTGGDHDTLRIVNQNLAEAAERCAVAMGVGSQRVMFTEPAARESFRLRPCAPRALLLANLGAAQLNTGFGMEQCREAVQVLGADALCLHLNPLQEAVQAGGDTNFAGLAARIGGVAAELEVPVILKEVGAGISPEDVRLVIKKGVEIIDVAGRGGTSFSRVEHSRGTDDSDLGIRFQDWGIPTPVALQLLAPFAERLTLIASGGIRTGIDMAKAVVLGASLCGVAAPLLPAARSSAAEVVRQIERLRREFRTAMFLLGAGQVSDLFRNQALLLSLPPSE